MPRDELPPIRFVDSYHGVLRAVRESTSLSSPTHSMRIALWSAVSVLGAFGAIWATVESPARANKTASWPPPPIKVAVTSVKQKSWPQLLTAIGSLEAARQVTLQSEVDGRVSEILFQPGDTVHTGQLLVQLSDEPEQADLLRLNAHLQQARLKLERIQRLIPQRMVSQEQLDIAQAEYDQAVGDRQKALALIEQKRIKAPFYGVVGIRRINLGQFAQAGDAIATLTDGRAMFVNFNVPEQTIGTLATTQSVDVTVDAYRDRQFSGTITAIEPHINAKTRMVQVQATLENADGALTPGMFANVDVNLPAHADVLLVPETAITYAAHGDSVFVIRTTDSQRLTVQQVYVETGERRDGQVVIKSGVNTGDQVVTSGQLRLSNDAVVVIADQDSLGS